MNEGHLKEDYKPNPKIYEEFLELYKQLKEQRNQVQSYSKMIQKYKNITNLYNEKSLELEQFKERNKEKLKSLDNKITESINLLNEQNAKIKKDQLSISNKLKRLTNDKEQAERNYSTIKEQKPSMMFFQKIFNPNNAKDYLDKLAHANEELNEINNLKNELMKNEEILSNELLKNNEEINRDKIKLEEENEQYEKQLKNKQREVDKIMKEKMFLENEKTKTNIEELDFSQSYSKLQLSSPWFDKHFRSLQSELFILSLKVRKQFLYENVKHLSAARNVWLRQSDHVSK